MREVLCACQAVDGRIIRFSGAAAGGRGGAEIAPEAGVAPVHRQAVLRLCELGWLFRRAPASVVRGHLCALGIACFTAAPPCLTCCPPISLACLASGQLLDALLPCRV